MDKAGVAEVQRLLTRLAFKPGPADGVLGQWLQDQVGGQRRPGGAVDVQAHRQAILETDLFDVQVALGEGVAGPMWRKVLAIYQDYKQELRNA